MFWPPLLRRALGHKMRYLIVAMLALGVASAQSPQKPTVDSLQAEISTLRKQLQQAEQELERERKEHSYDSLWCGGALQVSRNLAVGAAGKQASKPAEKPAPK